MSTTRKNGARVKILRYLEAQGMLTVSELSEFSGLTAGQARDNANGAVKDGLATKCRDDVTISLAYRITAAGRAYLAYRWSKENSQESPKAAPTCGEHQSDSRTQILRTEMRQRLASKYANGYAVAHVDDSAQEAVRRGADGIALHHFLCGSGQPLAVEGEHIEDFRLADLETNVDAIDATEPEPPPEQYAICRAGQAHLSAWPLRDMTIEAARQLAIDDAAAVGGEVILYRCTAIGRAFPRIIFEDAT
jgi:DNA-binding MarR family transcriptional regulator